MQKTEKPERWNKGIFKKGEFKQYLKTMSEKEAEFLLCKKENQHVPELIQTIAMVDSLGRMLKKNKRKKLKIKRLNQKYNQERNERIKKRIINFFKFQKTYETTEQINNKITSIELQKTIDNLLERYGDDWEHQHRRNLDEAKDTTYD